MGRTYGVTLAMAALLISGCTRTSEQTILAYSALGRSVHLDLAVDGYVIGIEKYHRNAIGNPGNGYPDRLTPLSNPDHDALVTEQNKAFLDATSDPKAMVVTHIASYFPHRAFIYNAYAKDLSGDIGYEKGYAGLSEWKRHFQDRIVSARSRGNPYSHIFVMSMGWNNDQYVAVYRYNRIVENLMDAARRHGDAGFHPLVIGFTWPSAWFTIEDSWLKKKIAGHLGSYGNKSDDADEIGYSVANWLVNHQLPAVRDAVGADHFPTVVALGHSMGARALSRAVFSRGHLDPRFAAKDGVVTLFVGLQGAFSARRFVAEDSGEGAPYRDYASNRRSSS